MFVYTKNIHIVILSVAKNPLVLISCMDYFAPNLAALVA